eukprot:4290505-Amphidinium_carterae.1
MSPKHGIQHAFTCMRPAVNKQALKKPAQRQLRPRCHQYLVQQRLLNDHVCCPIFSCDIGPCEVDGSTCKSSQHLLLAARAKAARNGYMPPTGAASSTIARLLLALSLPSTIQKTMQMLEGKFVVSRHYVSKVQIRLQCVFVEQRHMRFALATASQPLQFEADETYFGLCKGEDTCGEPEFVAFIRMMAQGLPAAL